MKKLLTIAIIQQGDRVLLGMKKRGFGAGHWNGFGGKVEPGETIKEGAQREVREEAGVEVRAMTEVGILTFTFESEDTVREAHVFRVTQYAGEPKETEEMRPEWFSVARPPLDQMWPGDTHWLPLFLQGKLFRGYFHYDRPSDVNYVAKILRQSLNAVDSLENQ